MSTSGFTGGKCFDFIICGGGTSGLALASRLTENPEFNVLVVEAGSDRRNDPMVSTPGTFLQIIGDDKYDHNFVTTPQKAQGGVPHKMPRGKGLGGSSMINFMMYSHCSKRDLEVWKDLGNPGWGWDDLLPYFQKAEQLHLPQNAAQTALSLEYIQPEIRGKNGMVHTSWQGDAFTWMQETWAQQSKGMGYPTTTDPRTGSSLGLFNQMNTIDPKDGTRSYAAPAYLAAADGRKNLTVMTESFVTKVLFDQIGSKPRAVGVEVETSGTAIEIKASKEVVICGGVVQSPQLLELSGIGQASLLAQHNIPLIVENPAVGENLSDHPIVNTSVAVKPGHFTAEYLRDNPSLIPQAMELYAKTHTGPIASGPTCTGFLNLASIGVDPASLAHLAEPKPPHLPQSHVENLLSQLQDPAEATLQILGTHGGCPPPTSLPQPLGSVFFHDIQGNYMNLVAGVVHPWSRGNIHITSNNVHDQPAIDPRYVSHPMDIELLAHGLLHLYQIARTPPIADFLVDGGTKTMPGHESVNTLEEARQIAKKNAVSCWHPAGTCAMLPRAEGGVVDPELKVYGVEGLRVVDASVFPMHVQGNIMSLVYAVAEKASDLIKGEHAGEKVNGTNGTNGTHC